MAEEEFIAVTPITDNNLKRKLEDIEDSSLRHVSAPDSIDQNDANDDDESSKRPRFDQQQQPDSLASENGYKPAEDNGNAETEAGIESVETAVDDQGSVEEGAKEAIPEELNEAQPVVEVEQKVDGKDYDTEGKDVEVPSSETAVPKGEENTTTEGAELGESGSTGISRKIEIPNNKVGVLIGKSGDTIKYLQLNSGAKIQITRDVDADPLSTTRPVELVGTLGSLNKAERLIKDVIAEADAGGNPSFVARGFTAAISTGSIEIEMPVPGDKAGLIIGRGGETIRNLQTRSGARIQLIPQNVPGEQPAKEKKVKVTGDKKQVEVARELIKEAMNQQPGRPSQFSSGSYNQQGYRPHGHSGGPQWASHGPHLSQTKPYDYHQRGPYPSQNQQYPPQPYANYPPQGPPRSSHGSWDHRPPVQGPPSHGGGYDYYGQGGGHAGNAPVSNPHSTHMPGHHTSGPSMAPPPYQANYNYPQPRGQDYAHPTPYPQAAPSGQIYGHGNSDSKYVTQAPVQQQPPYSGQGYGPQQGYASQQQYNRPPAYAMSTQGAPPQGYAPSAGAPYQAPVTATQPYSQNLPPQQQYPQAPYRCAPVTNDGYIQPQQPATSYPQAGQPIPVYGQPGYTQTAGSTTGCGQYPTTAQPNYNDQSGAATTAASYGYPGQVDPSAYGATPQGYAQPAPTQPAYDQSAQTGGYASGPAGAPVAYGKTLSPQAQPGYPQYDASQQVYTAPR